MKKCRKSRVRLPLGRRSIVSANACKVVAHRRFVFVRSSSSCFSFTISLFYLLSGDCQKRREQVRNSSSSFSFTMSLFFTCLLGTVRRGGNKSGAPAAVSASQYLYFLLAFRGLSEEEGTSQEFQQLDQLHNVSIFYLLTGDCQKRREQVRSSSSCFSFTMSLFFTCYRRLSEEEGTSQELKQLFQLHDAFIFYLLTGDCQKRREQARSSSSCSGFPKFFIFTCLQGTVRRGGNKSGAPAAG
jgi:hypothetical protein